MGTKKLTPLSNRETAAFCSQMAIILKSGISSIEGVSIMLEDAKEADEKELLSGLHETLMNTGIFYEALKETGVFPDYLLYMVQIGEQTGKLDEVMESLAEYYEKEANLAQTIKNAVTYPLVMIVMMLLVVIVLITRVMPVFNQVFRQLGSEMTGISHAILSAGEFMNRYAAVFICIFAALAVLIVYLIRSSHGQKLFRSFLDKFRSTRSFSENIAAYRFSNGMALTLSSGLTPEECLNLTVNLIDQDSFRTKLDKCRDAVSQGDDLCDSLLANGIFTGIYARMASIASRTGMLDEVMRKIASQYEDDIDSRLSAVIATVEPTLVIILSVIVGVILLSVMLPLMGIMTGL
ncbi:MAG: type II secretion system F family protein [Coprococcus sp.]|nr:type II secretion system F family protein [Coprococcus sp.]